MDVNNEIAKALIDINNSLSLIANLLLSQNQKIPLLQSVMKYFPGFITTIIGALFGYYVSRIHEKRKHIRDVHFDFLKQINRLNYEFNEVSNQIINIDKVSSRILQEEYTEYRLLNEDDYYTLATKALQIKKSVAIIPEDIYTKYKESLINHINDFTSYNRLVINITSISKDASNYLFLIKPNIKMKYMKLMDDFETYTQNDMKQFYVNKYGKEILSLPESSLKCD
jgi:hypothetical protein